MAKIDLDRIIKDSLLSESELAKILFPSNTHPEKSLQRILKGESELKETQIVALSNRLGEDFNTLFSNSWTSKNASEHWLFINESLNAQVFFDTANFSYTIFRGNEIVVNTTMAVKSITLKDFIKTVESQLN